MGVGLAVDLDSAVVDVATGQIDWSHVISGGAGRGNV